MDFEVLKIRIEPGNSTEEHEAKLDREDEQRIALALAGKIKNSAGSGAERYRDIVSDRIAACVRVAGSTWTELRKNDPERYRRFLRGCTRAIKREAALASGELSQADLAELRRRYNLQRDVDRYEAEFPDFDDYGERVSP